MLMQALVYVDPYGGLYKPGKMQQKVADIARPLHRITLFSSEVQYPKAALPLYILPDDLLQYFHATFERDERGEFPVAFIQELRWTHCFQCRQPPRPAGVSLLHQPGRSDHAGDGTC